MSNKKPMVGEIFVIQGERFMIDHVIADTDNNGVMYGRSTSNILSEYSCPLYLMDFDICTRTWVEKDTAREFVINKEDRDSLDEITRDSLDHAIDSMREGPKPDPLVKVLKPDDCKYHDFVEVLLFRTSVTECSKCGTRG